MLFFFKQNSKHFIILKFRYGGRKTESHIADFIWYISIGHYLSSEHSSVIPVAIELPRVPKGILFSNIVSTRNNRATI